MASTRKRNVAKVQESDSLSSDISEPLTDSEDHIISPRKKNDKEIISNKEVAQHKIELQTSLGGKTSPGKIPLDKTVLEVAQEKAEKNGTKTVSNKGKQKMLDSKRFMAKRCTGLSSSSSNSSSDKEVEMHRNKNKARVQGRTQAGPFQPPVASTPVHRKSAVLFTETYLSPIRRNHYVTRKAAIESNINTNARNIVTSTPLPGRHDVPFDSPSRIQSTQRFLLPKPPEPLQQQNRKLNDEKTSKAISVVSNRKQIEVAKDVRNTSNPDISGENGDMLSEKETQKNPSDNINLTAIERKSSNKRTDTSKQTRGVLSSDKRTDTSKQTRGKVANKDKDTSSGYETKEAQGPSPSKDEDRTPESPERILSPRSKKISSPQKQPPKRKKRLLNDEKEEEESGSESDRNRDSKSKHKTITSHVGLTETVTKRSEMITQDKENNHVSPGVNHESDDDEHKDSSSDSTIKGNRSLVNTRANKLRSKSKVDNSSPWKNLTAGSGGNEEIGFPGRNKKRGRPRKSYPYVKKSAFRKRTTRAEKEKQLEELRNGDDEDILNITPNRIHDLGEKCTRSKNFKTVPTHLSPSSGTKGQKKRAPQNQIEEENGLNNSRSSSATKENAPISDSADIPQSKSMEGSTNKGKNISSPQNNLDAASDKGNDHADSNSDGGNTKTTRNLANAGAGSSRTKSKVISSKKGKRNTSPEQGVRKSKRTRLAPVAHWKGERVKYKVGPDFCREVVCVENKLPESDTTDSNTSSKSAHTKGPLTKFMELKSLKANRKLSVRKTVPLLYEREVCDIELFSSLRCDGDVTEDTSKAAVFTGIENPGMSSGYLEMSPSSELEDTAYDINFVFFVVSGNIAVEMVDIEKKLVKGDFFFVPKDNNYKIRNESKSAAILFFTKYEN